MTKILIGVGVISALLIGLFVYNFTIVRGGTTTGKTVLELSTIDISGKPVTLCRNTRIKNQELGLLDFSKAPSTELKAFKDFALQHSPIFLRPSPPYQKNYSNILAARKCLKYQREIENRYVMLLGEYPSIASHHVYVEDGHVVHIDAFYLNRTEESTYRPHNPEPDIDLTKSD